MRELIGYAMILLSMIVPLVVVLVLVFLENWKIGIAFLSTIVFFMAWLGAALYLIDTGIKR